MADKPKDNKPATEYGEVKVIKNEREVDPGKTPGAAEGSVPPGGPKQPDQPGKTPDKAEG
ncbi:MAG: hypothetical protein E6J78_06920 [Deltaproteobacteria bacterium]|nr:MAG: hypothetical protein E6J78_06920 [Deltaproteobacteria bacterium]